MQQQQLQQARENMIEQQVRPWDVLDQRVLDALGSIPREEFVSHDHRGLAFSDFQLPIGFGQTLLKPIIDGRLLQALNIQLTDSILEIGAGSGYLSACLSRLGKECDSVEIHPELASLAHARLKQLGIGNVTLLQQDASEPWDARDAYQAIAFGGSVEAVPTFYLNKLAVGGRLFAVVGNVDTPTMEAQLITRISETEWRTDSQFETRLDPLINFAANESTFIF
ncbi:MAG: protein-L-isoaspartate O-methyltransferase [Granulosicoccaceae bacterium]